MQFSSLIYSGLIVGLWMFEDGDNWHISLMDKVTATELNPPVSCVCHKISQQILTT